MAVETSDSRIDYAGNGDADIAYPIPFPFHHPADILVAIKDQNGVIFELDPGAYDVHMPPGAEVVLDEAVPTTSTVIIFREVPYTQPTVYPEGGRFLAQTHEKTVDRATFQIQQLDRSLDHTFRIDELSVPLAPLVPEPLALIGYDENGQPTNYSIQELGGTLVLVGVSGSTMVSTEAQLRAAVIAGGNVTLKNSIVLASSPLDFTAPCRLNLNGCMISASPTFPVVVPVVVGGVVQNQAAIEAQNYVIRPIAPDVKIYGGVLSGKPGVVADPPPPMEESIAVVWLNGYSRGAHRFALVDVTVINGQRGVYVTGGVSSPVLEDFTMRHCVVKDYAAMGIDLEFQLNRVHLSDLTILGGIHVPVLSGCDALYLKTGILDMQLHNITIDGGYGGFMGMEIYYPHEVRPLSPPALRDSPGGKFVSPYGGIRVPGSRTLSDSGPAQISLANPNGPGGCISNISIRRTASMGMSIAGCKRMVLSNITIHDCKYGVGAEFCDEQGTELSIPPEQRVDVGPTGMLVTGLFIKNVGIGTGVQTCGLSIDQIRDSTFSFHVEDIGTEPGASGTDMGCNIRNCERIRIVNSRFIDAGPDHIYVNDSPNCEFYGNTFRGSGTNALRFFQSPNWFTANNTIENGLGVVVDA